MLASVPHIATWLICAGVLTGVILRPWGLPEAWWVALGVAVLILCSLITLPAAWIAIRKGTDVYLFLAGMMLLAELARHEGLFEWLAAWAVQRARGSASRLFALVYSVGTLVTIFLSNDATAVVLTPAVYAVAMRARARPMPYLYTCAFIANAASFVLPISNPANLVVYGSNMPPLGRWLEQFGVAALLAVVVTFLCLRFLQRAALRDQIAQDVRVPALTSGGRLAAGGILAAALLLLLASGLQWQLGLPTISAGVVTTVVLVMSGRIRYWNIVKSISWSVLPLVAGLFVLVAAIEATGVLAPLLVFLVKATAARPEATAFGTGAVIALACNLINNLPLGLIAGSLTTGAALSPQMNAALLVGVDLGPNLSVTGSLATILWLVALRREGQAVSGWSFLRLGSVLMPLALIAALACVVLNI